MNSGSSVENDMAPHFIFFIFSVAGGSRKLLIAIFNLNLDL